MRVLIFGGTGRTGVAVVNALLARDAEVALFCRPTSVVPPALKERVTQVVGNSKSVAEITAALAGVDAIVIAVGNSALFHKETLRGDVTRAVASAVRDAEKRDIRVVAVSVLGARGSGDQLPWYVRGLALTVLAKPIADHDVQEQVLEDTLPAEQWLIVRPVGLNDRASTGDYFVCTRGQVRSWRVSRADVGDFVAGQIFSRRGGTTGETEDYFGQCVAISS